MRNRNFNGLMNLNYDDFFAPFRNTVKFMDAQVDHYSQYYYKDTETNRTFCIAALGFEKSDLKIKIGEDFLSIAGKREPSEDNFPLEIDYKFQLSNNDYLYSETRSELKNGILKIIIPRKNQEKKLAKEIPIL